MLFMCAFNAQSITFKPTIINEPSEPSYLRFEGQFWSLSNSFEKIAADFNGDGHDDILSKGGDISLINILNIPSPPIIPFAPLEMMIYHDGSYIKQDLNFDNFSNKANVIDVDSDGDLDIVMMNGKIAINDGLAHFSITEFSNTRYLANDFFTADIDADGDLDIISKNYIFINDGNLTFSETVNVVTSDSDVYSVVDINNDGFIDMIVVHNNEIHSWINDGAGNFEILSSIQSPHDVHIIHALSQTEDNLQNVMVAYHDGSQDKLLLLENDGLGNFESNPFTMPIENIEFDSFRIGKLSNQDTNNNGNDELWISGVFLHNASCENFQNLLFIYNQSSDENWNHQVTLHSEGLNKEDAISNRMTVDSFPTVVDLNNDQLPDVVFTGNKPQTWLSQEVVYNEIGVDFKMSQASKNQYIQNIDAVDYNNDGNVDIFSTARYSGDCSIINYSEGLNTAAYQVGSTLWMNDGNGSFETFSSPFGGGNDFLRPFDYVIFADLENDGVQNIIATVAAQDDRPQESFYIYPRIVDPALFYKLPETTMNAKVVNTDNTVDSKEIIMIADTQEAPIIILSLNNGQFLEIARLEFGARNGEFKLADMDNDGNIDIIASHNIGGDNTTTIWYNNGNREFIRGEDFADNAFSIAVLDVNSDGLLDLFSSSRDIRLNRGNREFEKISYNSNFWSLPWGLSSLQYLVPKKMKIVDFNSDGKDDVLFSNYNDYYVYINDSTEDQILFYSAYITKFKSNSGPVNFPFDHYNAVVTDINNDNKMDFVINTGNRIQINTQVQEQAITGIYYAPSHNGHGFSTHDLGRKNLYYSIFYSYDGQGKPEWYTTLNRYTGYENESESRFYFTTNETRNEIHFLYDYTTQTAQANPDTQYLGNITFSNSSQNNTLDGMSYFIGDEYGSWDIQPIISETQKPEVDFSGLWWAGENDNGWGISLSFIQRENTQEVVAILYFYDEAGEPRWLIGQQDGFQLNQELTINMNQINGYGRDQNYVELTQFSAGTITLNLNQASNNLNEAGLMSMDVFYPDDQPSQNNWIRNNIPIALFSVPMN